MTVKYTDKFASRGGFGSFWKLLARWRGSVYKVVWQDMLAYVILYYFINFIYRFALDDYHQRNFELLVMHISRFRGFIPLSLVLGFYVSLVVSRWWGVYQCIPWPDKAAIIVATHLPGQTPEVREARRDILRYINLTIALTFKMVSPPVARKLTSLNSFIHAGYLTEEEKDILDTLSNESKQHKTWVPAKFLTLSVAILVLMLMVDARPDRCWHPIDPGFCRGFFPKFGFDPVKMECVRFIYGGCRGNANKFDTMEECKLTCEE